MRNPRIFLCYAPRAGLRCAVAYLAGDRHVHGWFTGPGETGRLESAYFMLEDHYTPLETRYTAVADGELHGKWAADETMCHELAQLQEAFSREWLFYRADPRAAPQIAQYAKAELALGDVNVRFELLDRFSKDQAAWTYYSHDFEHGVLKVLGKHWPLDYRLPSESFA
ncbi:MAG: hypothetical protein ACXWG1_17775 [Usitatibacter sp.]